jgi:hypothetical protein
VNINEFRKYVGVVIGTNYYTLARVWNISGWQYCENLFPDTLLQRLMCAHTHNLEAFSDLLTCQLISLVHMPVTTNDYCKSRTQHFVRKCVNIFDETLLKRYKLKHFDYGRL